jgi:hypothetical protein
VLETILRIYIKNSYYLSHSLILHLNMYICIHPALTYWVHWTEFLLASCQTIRPSLKASVRFRKTLLFYGKWVVGPHLTWKLEAHQLSAAHAGHFIRPESEGGHAVVTTGPLKICTHNIRVIHCVVLHHNCNIPKLV